MKKIVGLIIGLILWFPGLTSGQETAERTVIEAVPSGRNVVLTQPSNQIRWLIKLKPGCPTALQKGDEVRLGVSWGLNGKNDYLDIGANRRCEVAQAFEFNEVFTILNTTHNSAFATDEEGKHWNFFHQDRCGSLTNFMGKEVYVYQAGKALAAGDIIYVPGEPRRCAITLIESADPSGPIPAVDPTIDTRRPSDVPRVRAVGKNGKALVYWRAAQDDVGIDHYVVSYSRNTIDPRHLTFDSAENKIETAQKQITIEPLENDRDYYFYVMAVDAAGNRSSFWSPAAHARVSSSAPQDRNQEAGLRRLDLRLANESSRSFLFRWVFPPTGTRFLISLTSDGKNEFAFTESVLTSLRVLKRPGRAGKKLLLKVAAFNPLGFIEEEKIEFGF